MRMQPRVAIAAAWLARQRPDYRPESVDPVTAVKREPVVRIVSPNGQVVLRYRSTRPPLN